MLTFTDEQYNEFLKDILHTEEVRDTAKKILRSGECTPRQACILGKRFFNPNTYGTHLEAYIKAYFGWVGATDETSGDAISKKGIKIEIKVTTETADKDKKWNFSQLRPSHDVDYYVGMVYSQSTDKVYFLKIPHAVMCTWILRYAKGYSHGTIKEKGAITEEAIQRSDNEFTVFFGMHNDDKNKSKQAWDDLVPFIVSEEELAEL